MDITWRISFSGRTPGKLTLGDVLGGISAGSLFNQTEYEKQQGHSRSEILSTRCGEVSRYGIIELTPFTAVRWVCRSSIL